MARIDANGQLRATSILEVFWWSVILVVLFLWPSWVPHIPQGYAAALQALWSLCVLQYEEVHCRKERERRELAHVD